ncbi:ABC transporter substrate-binding protein [Methanosphaerula subterraneus]|uniref:ABC transporter substrate-binding protein n=1 Tax=Methanosphaerula subterraneus TaxID=3350244 RepID=UPI003F86CE1F
MKKEQSYILAALVLFVVAGVLIAGCTGSSKTTTSPSTATQVTTPSTDQAKSLKIGYLPSTGHALVFIAKERGFFEKEGLNVELSQFQNSADGTNAILAKKLDTGGFGPSPLVFISKGSPETIIGGLMGEGAGVITTADKADQFKDIKNFKGRTVATVRQSSGDIHFRAALMDAGIDLNKDVTIQELASPSAVLDAVKAGKVDAGVVWTPYMEMAENQGLKTVILTADIFPKHPCCRVAVLTEELTTNRDSYVRMERALLDAYKYQTTNPDESVDAIAKYVDIDKSIIKSALTNGHSYISPDPNTKGVEKTYEMLKQIGYINSPVNISEHIDSTVYKQALDDVSRANPNDPFFQNLQAEYQTLNS